MNTTVIILTYNEELHLERCIRSLEAFSAEIIIVDSFSSDATLSIAKRLGARVYQNKWVNYARQFQWALDHCPIHTPWVMRMDADEYIPPELAKEIQDRLGNLPRDVKGVILKRRVHFMNQWIKYGGYYPIKLLRIWRVGSAQIEQRWMDEHIVMTSGKIIEFKHDFIDHNLHNLSWWTAKHNNYATREAADLLNQKYHFFPEGLAVDQGRYQGQAKVKRRLKKNLYQRTPLFLRAFCYFCFRYFFQLGFLDGKAGLIWHFLQGFWYRFLVDAKIVQIEHRARKHNKTIVEILREDYQFPGV